MNYHILTAGILIVLLLAAGCSDEPGSDASVPVTTAPLPGAQYAPGDIVAKTATQAEPLWLVLAFDQKTDRYERALIFRKPDGSWGYRKDTRSDMFPRHDMETVYPVRIGHVTVSAVPVVTPTAPVTVTTTAAYSGTSPEITGITPSNGATGSIVTITNLAGRNFVSGATVKLIGASAPPIIASQVNAIDTKITCVFNLNGAEAGKRDVVVTNPDGQSYTLVSAFTVNEEAPVLSAIDPYSGTIGETLTLSLSGRNFKNPAKVIFTRNGAELEASTVQVHSVTQITCVLNIPTGTQPGEWDVIVRNVADKQNSTTLKKFTISNAT